MSVTLTFSQVSPSPEAYLALRATVGLGARSPEAAARGLSGGLHGEFLYDGARLVGMGRVVGDGGSFAHVVDIAVAPEFQGQGHGREILRRLDAWCNANLPASCYVSLIANPGAVPLYERAGYGRRIGMGRYIPEG